MTQLVSRCSITFVILSKEVLRGHAVELSSYRRFPQYIELSSRICRFLSP
jgi:hypothetical protein